MRRNIRRAARAFARVSAAQLLRGAGAAYHFDPASGASDDGTTGAWIDRIAGQTVASTSQATRLTYSASVSGLNNRPGWTGVAGSLTKIVSSEGALAAVLDGSDAYTIYIVCKASSVAAASTIVCAGNTATGHLIKHGSAITTGAQVYSRNGGSLVSSTGVVGDGTGAVITSCVYSGTAASAWSNAGPSVVAAAHVQAPTCDRFVIGALMSSGAYSEHFSGDIGDIVIFLSAHTAAQRMYVERVLAAKYGWTVLQGLTGFSVGNYLDAGANPLGIQGVTGVGVWHDALIRLDAVPTGFQHPHTANSASNGWALYSGNTTGPIQTTGATGAAVASSPTRTIVAADVGKLVLAGGSASQTIVRMFWNGAEVGAGTALAGYAKSATQRYCVGDRYGVNLPATSYSIFGTAGGDSPQVAADQAARAAAIKAAGRFVTTGGVTPSHGWALDSAAATIADIVGTDALTRSGTLTQTQIIVPTWPW